VSVSPLQDNGTGEPVPVMVVSSFHAGSSRLSGYSKTQVGPTSVGTVSMKVTELKLSEERIGEAAKLSCRNQARQPVCGDGLHGRVAAGEALSELGGVAGRQAGEVAVLQLRHAGRLPASQPQLG